MKDNKLSEEYLRETAKFFQRAKAECLIPGKDMLTQDWKKPTDIYWAALGTVMNACKAYRVYRTQRIIQEAELEQLWSEEISLINNAEMMNLFDSLMNSEEAAKNGTIDMDEAKSCLEKADLLLNGLLNTIPPHIRIQIGS